MKKLALLCGTLQVLLWPAGAQLVLSAGDTWTSQFDALPRTGSVSAFVATPGGSFAFTVSSSSFQPGAALRYEMFENSAGEVAICSGTLSSAPPFGAFCKTDGAWQDLQGVIRLTLLSGSLTVDTITVQAIKTGPSLSSYEVYSNSFVPMPLTTISNLSLARQGSQAIVSWPQGGTNGFYLQGATNLSKPVAWQDVTNTVYSLPDNHYTTNDLSGPRRFFRLQTK